jgi:phosphate transport system permease protein
MTDIAAGPASPFRRVDVTSAAAQARVRARYRKETRFKAYGLGALSLATLFVVVLIGDVLYRGLPAFWHNSLVLDVTIDPKIIAPDGKVDAAAIRSADYYPLTRAALQAAIPGIEGRSARKHRAVAQHRRGR